MFAFGLPDRPSRYSLWSVVTMQDMFKDATSFNQDVYNWDVAKGMVMQVQSLSF